MKKQHLLQALEGAFLRAEQAGYFKKTEESKEENGLGGPSGKMKGGKKGKSRQSKLGDSSKTYFSSIRTYINTKITEKVEESKDEKYYNPKFWKGGWFDEYLSEMVDRYHADELSASYIERTVHAAHKVNEILKEDKFMGKGLEKIRFGLKGSVEDGVGQLNMLHDEGVIDSKDNVTSIKPKGGEFEKIKDAIPKSNRNYETIINLLESQLKTGGRIKAELSLKVGDIDYEKNLKKYIKDKNKFNRNTPINSKDIEFFKNLEKDKDGENKKVGSPLFPIFDKKGKQMSVEDASKYVQEVLHRAAEASGINQVGTIYKKTRDGDIRAVEVTMRFTTHSLRRQYGQREYDMTRYWSRERIDKETAEYLNNQGSNKEKIIKRIEKEKERLNYYNIKHGKPRADLSWENARRLLVSLKLGHSRIDIVSRYVEVDKPIHMRKQQKEVKETEDF